MNKYKKDTVWNSGIIAGYVRDIRRDASSRGISDKLKADVFRLFCWCDWISCKDGTLAAADFRDSGFHGDLGGFSSVEVVIDQLYCGGSFCEDGVEAVSMYYWYSCPESEKAVCGLLIDLLFHLAVDSNAPQILSVSMGVPVPEFPK